MAFSLCGCSRNRFSISVNGGRDAITPVDVSDAVVASGSKLLCSKPDEIADSVSSGVILPLKGTLSLHLGIPGVNPGDNLHPAIAGRGKVNLIILLVTGDHNRSVFRQINTGVLGSRALHIESMGCSFNEVAIWNRDVSVIAFLIKNILTDATLVIVLLVSHLLTPFRYARNSVSSG